MKVHKDKITFREAHLRTEKGRNMQKDGEFYKQIKGWDETKHNCNRHCCDVNEAGKCSLKGTDTRFGFNNVFFLIFTICSVVSLITVFTAGTPSLSTVFKVKVAPRVIIVEKIKELAK